MLDGRVGLDTKYDQLPDGADLQSSERAGQAWQTEQDYLLVVLEMPAGDRRGRRAGRHWYEARLTVWDICRREGR